MWSLLVQVPQSVNLLTGKNALNEYASPPTILIIQSLRVGGQRESEGASERERKHTNREHHHSDTVTQLLARCKYLVYCWHLHCHYSHFPSVTNRTRGIQWRQWLKRDIPWSKPIIKHNFKYSQSKIFLRAIIISYENTRSSSPHLIQSHTVRASSTLWQYTVEQDKQTVNPLPFISLEHCCTSCHLPYQD